MFGILKKKLGDFGQKLKETLQKKEPTIDPDLKETTAVKEKIPKAKEKILEEKISKPKKTQEKVSEKIIEETKVSEKEQKVIEELNKELESELSEFKENEIEEQIPQKVVLEKEIKKPVINKDSKKVDNTIETKEELSIENEIDEKIETQEQKISKRVAKPFIEEKRELKATIRTTEKLKSFFTGAVEIKENDIKDLLWELELSLIESDVEQDAAHEIVEKIKQRLVGSKVSSKQIDQILKENIKQIITEMMQTQKINLVNEIKNKKPFVIMFLGPNGAGKTTSIAKLTHYLQKNNFSSTWAAADTFRSGAIDQLQIHADKLNVKMVKHQYGADPAAVAFDAIKSASANNIDVVMIDTAGRQETNKNLMEELKKIERIAKPNLKIYVGESYTGQSLVDMSTEFNNAVGIDGFILTKIDTDAKGGTAISLTYKIKKPILFVGTGQEYKDFEEFDTKFIIERIL